jgi:hypothetical protein
MRWRLSIVDGSLHRGAGLASPGERGAAATWPATDRQLGRFVGADAEADRCPAVPGLPWLQELVDATPEGGVLALAPGRYSGPVVVTKKLLTLDGAPGQAIIDQAAARAPSSRSRPGHVDPARAHLHRARASRTTPTTRASTCAATATASRTTASTTASSASTSSSRTRHVVRKNFMTVEGPAARACAVMRFGSGIR